MIDFLPSDAKALHSIIADNEEWLVDRTLFYAKRQGYTRYTSTLREAWQQSVAGLSEPLLQTLEKGGMDVELEPDQDYTKDPLTQFGILEAQRHRKRGVSLNMFLGLMKYYRQSFIDLVDQEVADRTIARRISLFLKRTFDRIEIGLATTWHKTNEKAQMAELQQANRTITNEKNKYLSLFESLQSPAAVLDAGHRIDTVNHAWTELFSGTTTPGTDYYDDAGFCHMVEWLSEEITALTKNRENERIVEKKIKTNLGDRHLSVRIKRMLDESQKFSGCVILLDDITQQKTAETAHQETSIWLTEMFNALEEAVFLATPTGRIVDTNTAAERIFGYSPNEMKNRTTEFFHVNRDHYQKFKNKVREILSKGERAVFEYRIKRKNGEVFPAVMNIALLSKSDGTPLGIVCVLRDISELKKAEEANRKNERLQGALELAGAVCHDMNQPLMAISGYAELVLMECPEDAPYTENLKKIINQVIKVGAITKKLMNVTRYETKPYLGQQIIDIEKASGN